MESTGTEINSIPALHFYFADTFNRGPITPLHLFIAYPHTSIERLPHDASKKDKSITLHPVGDNIYEMKIRNRKRATTGWLITKNMVWLFYIYSEESSVVGSIAENWISGMNPYLSLIRITPDDLFSLLDSISSTSNQSLMLEDYLTHSYRPHIRKRYEGQKNWASQKGWTSEVYDRARLERDISATNSVLDAIKIEFPNEKISFIARISRKGHLTFYRGQEQGFSNFYSLVVDNYIRVALNYRKTLENKEITITEKENHIHPLIFRNKLSMKMSDFNRMIEAMTEEPNYMVSVIHKGNPWLYLTVVDRAGGNTCEIYGFEDGLEIIPQLKATPESLAQLEGLVYEVFPDITKTN